MNGRRIYPPNQSEIIPSEIQRGDYWFDNQTQSWFGCVPNGLWCNLKAHTVVEHEDKTITVSPSILVTGHDNEKNEKARWHGYLERGVWREVD